jgi:hypothetical protein
MPLYAIRRQIDATLPEEELDALTMRAIGSSAEYRGVLWQRSYQWSDAPTSHSLCIYEAPSVDAIREHARRCTVPFNEIREVTEYLGSDHVIPEDNEPPGDGVYFLITRTMPADTTAEELDAAVLRSGSCMGNFDISWVRSYWDDDRKRSSCIYLAPEAELIRKHAELARIACDSIQEVTEQLPSEFASLYDAFGLPRHWEGETESVAQTS